LAVRFFGCLFCAFGRSQAVLRFACGEPISWEMFSSSVQACASAGRLWKDVYLRSFSPHQAPPVCCFAVRLQGSCFFLARAFLLEIRFSSTLPPGTASPMRFLGCRFFDMTARRPFGYSIGAGFHLLWVHPKRPALVSFEPGSSPVCGEFLLCASPIVIYTPVLRPGGSFC
jgi:hypothetical protein